MGIYTIIELAYDCPTCAITRDEVPKCYPKHLKVQGQQIINTFSKYNNTLAFSAGNEVNHYAPINIPQWNAPCQKKFIYDMKQYIHNTNNRKVPVGLVSADNDRITLAEYYAYPETDSGYDVPDWYGLNAYLYCDGNITNYHDATGFKEMVHQFDTAKLPFPIVLTEFGCLSPSFPNVAISKSNKTSLSTGVNDDNNKSNSSTMASINHSSYYTNGADIVYEGQRTFLQAYWLVNEPNVLEVLAGGLAFEYSIEMENAKTSASFYPFYKFGYQNYGIGYFSPPSCDDYEILCEYNPYPEFDNLSRMYRNVRIIYYTNNSNGDDVMNASRNYIYPTQFPHFNSYHWESDQWLTISHPFSTSSSSLSSWLFGLGHQNIIEQFQCPNNNEFHIVNESNAYFVTNESQKDTSVKNSLDTNGLKEIDIKNIIERFIISSLVVGSISLCCIRIKKIISKILFSTSESNSNDNNHLIIPSVRKIKDCNNDNEDDNESGSLLSLKGYNHNSASVGSPPRRYYYSISSSTLEETNSP